MTEREPVWPEILVRVEPVVTRLNEFFWTEGRDGVLRMLACAECGQLVHPPAPVCPACLGREVAPRALSGRGSVYTYTVNHQEWVPGQGPFTLAVVSIAEDPDVRLTTNIIRCDAELVRIDMEVEVEFVEWEGWFLPCFRPL